MKNLTIFILTTIITTILLASILFYFNNNKITGNIIKTVILENKNNNNDEFLDDYTYTKAICNSTNFCQDNLIKCDGNKLISITPITGAAVQFPNDWEDIRTKDEINRLCD